MTSKYNMVCDLETGICGPAEDTEMEMIDLTAPQKKLELYYVTDPICSHCWALEPVFGKFIEQYGQYFNVHTVMGGMLEKWDGFADVANGINGPADVAGHWREVGDYTRMPIDGTVWIDNPINSSYPPSRVFKVIQANDAELANTFLRRIREAVFPFNRNIAETATLIDVVNSLGLDGEAIVKEADSQAAQAKLLEDFGTTRSLGVRGFPTIIMLNEEKKGVKIVGSRPFEYYVQGLQQMLPDVELQPKQPESLQTHLQKKGLLFSREIEDMYDISKEDAVAYIQNNLTDGTYEVNEVLGEKYYKIK